MKLEQYHQTKTRSGGDTGKRPLCLRGPEKADGGYGKGPLLCASARVVWVSIVGAPRRERPDQLFVAASAL